MAPHAHAVALVSLAVLVLASSCDNAGAREASALSSAVDQYRRAGNAAKGERAQSVVAVTCTDAEVCAARAACLAAISPTVQALALKDDVAARLADLEAQRLAPDASEATALPAKLDDAERLLKEGHEKMEGCDKAMADLRMHHGG
jgi:hypothetical protein